MQIVCTKKSINVLQYSTAEMHDLTLHLIKETEAIIIIISHKEIQPRTFVEGARLPALQTTACSVPRECCMPLYQLM